MSKFEVHVRMEFVVEAASQQEAEAKAASMLLEMECEADYIRPLSRRRATAHGIVQG